MQPTNLQSEYVKDETTTMILLNVKNGKVKIHASTSIEVNPCRQRIILFGQKNRMLQSFFSNVHSLVGANGK